MHCDSAIKMNSKMRVFGAFLGGLSFHKMGGTHVTFKRNQSHFFSFLVILSYRCK